LLHFITQIIDEPNISKANNGTFQDNTYLRIGAISPTLPHHNPLTMNEIQLRSSAFGHQHPSSTLVMLSETSKVKPMQDNSHDFANKELSSSHLSESFNNLYQSLFSSIGHHQSFLQSSFSKADLNLTDDKSIEQSYSHKDGYQLRAAASEPYLKSLMDNLKGLAENNEWDKLSPLQIQSIRDTVNEEDHSELGIDQESYEKWSLSFNQFLSQLDDQIPHTTVCGSGFHDSHYLPLTVNASTMQHLPPPYSQSAISRHITSPVKLSSMLRGTSYLNHHHLSEPSSSLNMDFPPFKSVATDLFEDNDEDDFDWSKLV
jgi:hypothetical protein